MRTVKHSRVFPVLSALFLLCVPARGQPSHRNPSLGYVYPAGGCQGTSFRIVAGGQHLRGVSGVHFSGGGVFSTDLRYVPPLTNRHLREVRTKVRRRRNELLAAGRGQAAPREAIAPDAEPPALPEHPLLEGLEEMTMEQLAVVEAYLLSPRRRLQVKRSIQELAVFNVTITPEALPGDMELRLQTPLGLSNPLVFQVGTAPEINEREPNDLDTSALPVLHPPVLINGQIMPGDTDVFSFSAKKGQKLVIEARARSLIPYMADAVPGWLQAVLTVYNSSGALLACEDSYRFSPDPVIFFDAPEDGEYIIEIRDALFRGREDFVYRLSISEGPFITHIFPKGGKTGADAYSSVHGWNLEQQYARLDTAPGPERVRRLRLEQNGLLSNAVAYMTDSLPEITEDEPNDNPPAARHVHLPLTVNGRVGSPGDVDVFRFAGRAGEEITAEVYARRLGSPLDSLLRLTDSAGNLLAWNDDTVYRTFGLLTHHADSRLSFRFRSDDYYFLSLSDVRGHGGEEYVYRLRLDSPGPDFELFAAPSAINIPRGCASLLHVFAFRRDGFEGAIELFLKDAPPEISLDGGTIPAGRDEIRVTLQSTRRLPAEPLKFQIEGRARINGKYITRRAVPADNMMQAFGYMHLVPSQERLVSPASIRGRAPGLSFVPGGAVEITRGGETDVMLVHPPRLEFSEARVRLIGPPAWISLQDVRVDSGKIAFRIKADFETAPAGYEDNLILELSGKPAHSELPGGRSQRAIRPTLLPALPVRIVEAGGAE